RLRFGFSLLCGALLALACGAKMNSLVVVLLSGAALAFVVLRAYASGGVPRAVTALACGSIAALAAGGGFLAINPALLNAVWGGLAATVTEHRQTEAIQLKFITVPLKTITQKLGAVAELSAFSPTACCGLGVFAVWCLASNHAGRRFVACWWLIALVSV